MIHCEKNSEGAVSSTSEGDVDGNFELPKIIGLAFNLSRLRDAHHHYRPKEIAAHGLHLRVGRYIIHVVGAYKHNTLLQILGDKVSAENVMGAAVNGAHY